MCSCFRAEQTTQKGSVMLMAFLLELHDVRQIRLQEVFVDMGIVAPFFCLLSKRKSLNKIWGAIT
jgi:hypothetical protein